MAFARRVVVTRCRAVAAVVGCTALASGQAVNELPNRYATHQSHCSRPDGRTWGLTSTVDIDINGTSIWVGERGGQNNRGSSVLDSILKFDAARPGHLRNPPSDV